MPLATICYLIGFITVTQGCPILDLGTQANPIPENNHTLRCQGAQSPTGLSVLSRSPVQIPLFPGPDLWQLFVLKMIFTFPKFAELCQRQQPNKYPFHSSQAPPVANKSNPLGNKASQCPLCRILYQESNVLITAWVTSLRKHSRYMDYGSIKAFCN